MEKKKLYKKIAIFTLAGIIGLGSLGVITAAGLIIWASNDLPSYTDIADYRPPLTSTVYARDGSIMGYFYEEKRFLVNLSDMPSYLPQAFLAIEDSEFYEHDGVSPKAILRATLTNLRAGKTVSGGSTITQQVVKRILLTPQKTYLRKLQEAILAYRLEKYLSKDDILHIYLNQIFLGNGAYGVEAAARTYFAKHVGELTIAESAVLAALPQSPSKTNPFGNPEATKARQRAVLQRMLQVGFITQTQHDEAVAEVLDYKSMYDPSYKLGAWYLEEVRRRLLEFFSEDNVRDLGLPMETYGVEALFRSGMNIYTSMDPLHQKAAETALRQGLLDSTQRYGWNGPVRELNPQQMAQFIERDDFRPQKLDNAGWTQAVVTAVSPKEATVRMGAYTGTISAKEAAWARVHNPEISYDAKGQVRTPDKFLKVGHVVWVSAVGAEGSLNPVGCPASTAAKIAPYDSSKISASTPIALCLEQVPEVQGALVSIETNTGDVVAMVGGYQFGFENQLNRATQSRRQPGSSFKPIVYSAALDNGFTAASIIDDLAFVSDRKTSKGKDLWRPSNVDGQFLGPIILRSALVRSRNLCTIRVAQRIGLDVIIARAKQVGIEGEIQPDLSISLGSHATTPINMAEAYTAFANGGQRAMPRFIQKITNRWGQQIVAFEPEHKPSISPQNAYIISSILKDVMKVNARRTAGLKRIAAGKTGTTNEERDAWFMGYSPFLVTSVYVGFDEPRPMGRMETGSRAAVPIFTNYRKQVEDFYPDEDFRMPAGISLARIDGKKGYLAGPESSPVFTLPFYAGTQPRKVAGAALRRGEDDVSSGTDLFKQ